MAGHVRRFNFRTLFLARLGFRLTVHIWSENGFNKRRIKEKHVPITNVFGFHDSFRRKKASGFDRHGAVLVDRTGHTSV